MGCSSASIEISSLYKPDIFRLQLIPKHLITPITPFKNPINRLNLLQSLWPLQSGFVVHFGDSIYGSRLQLTEQDRGLWGFRFVRFSVWGFIFFLRVSGRVR